MADHAPRPSTTSSNPIYSATASSLNKRPMGQIMEEAQRKKGTKHKTLNPATKKHYKNIVSKLDTGVKKTKVATQSRQSNDLTVKKKDEMFGRVSTELVAKFLS